MNTDIKLVALDLDRTTLNSESHLSEVNRQALIDACLLYTSDAADEARFVGSVRCV